MRKGDDMQIKASGGKQSKAFHSRSSFIHRCPSAQGVRRQHAGRNGRENVPRRIWLSFCSARFSATEARTHTTAPRLLEQRFQTQSGDTHFSRKNSTFDRHRRSVSVSFYAFRSLGMPRLVNTFFSVFVRYSKCSAVFITVWATSGSLTERANENHPLERRKPSRNREQALRWHAVAQRAIPRHAMPAALCRFFARRPTAG